MSANAQPHVVPIVFCAYAGAIYSPLDDKRKRDAPLQRLVNLAADPRATLLLDEYTTDWQDLWWVKIEGRADLYEPGSDDAEGVATLLRRKYPQYQSLQFNFDSAAYLRLQPARITCWTQSGSLGAIERHLGDAHGRG